MRAIVSGNLKGMPTRKTQLSTILLCTMDITGERLGLRYEAENDHPSVLTWSNRS